MKGKATFWLAWWHLALAIGFALLGIAHLFSGDKAWLIGVRFVLAAGFGTLSRMRFVALKKDER